MPDDELPRNARLEGFERLDGAYEVRVLEPSPPAVHTPPYVDDPTARGEVPEGRLLVSPTSSGDLRWADLVRDDAALAAWAGDRWLAAYRRLGPPPATFAATREALHLLAEHVISPTRQRDHGEITLRWTLGGFGTPFFGKDAQLRVEGDVFVVQTATRLARGRLTTLGDAAEFVGFDLTRTDVAEARDALDVDRDAAHYLGDVYGFAFSIIEELRADASPELEPSLVALWPEHFDVAVELGRDDLGERAAFGVSPGDATHPEPYVYVSPWSAPGFEELPWRDVLQAEDQRGAALRFLRERLP